MNVAEETVVAPLREPFPAKERPRVVMLLANPFTHDTRVYKEARALVTWACDVTVVARDGKDLPQFQVQDGIEIERVAFAEASLLRSLWLFVVLRVGSKGALRRLLERNPASSSAEGRSGALRRLLAFAAGALGLMGAALAALVFPLVKMVNWLWRQSVNLAKWLWSQFRYGVVGGFALVFLEFPAHFAGGVKAVFSSLGRALIGTMRRIRQFALAVLSAFGKLLRAVLPDALYRPLRNRVGALLRRIGFGLRWRVNRLRGSLARSRKKQSGLRLSALSLLASLLNFRRPSRLMFPPSALPSLASLLKFPRSRRLVLRIQRGVRGVWRRSRSRFIRHWTPLKRSMARRRTLLRAEIRRRVRASLPAQAPILAMNLPFARHAIHHSPDILVAHDLNTLLAGLALKRLTGCSLVYDSHELYLERNIGDRSRFKENLFWKPIERLAIRECDAVFSVADGICEHLKDRYKIPKPYLIRNVQPYEPPGPRSYRLADSLGVPHDLPLAIYAGAITINRGIEELIESAKYLDGAAYVVMGYSLNPAFLEGLQEQARAAGVLGQTLYFHDAVPMDQVVDYVSSAALSVVPTRNACLSYYFEASNKIFHSLMAGVPVVMSDHPEKRLIVERHGVGALFDETCPRAIAQAVMDTLADGQAYAEMQRNCVHAARSLNWENEQYRLRGVFADLLDDEVPALPEIVLPAEPVIA